MSKKIEACRSPNLEHAPCFEQGYYNILVQIEQELKTDFESKQIYTVQLSRAYERLALNESNLKKRELYTLKSIKTNFCGSYLDFAIGGFHENGYDVFEKPKLYRANFCKDRFCPMCNSRRSKKFTAQLLQVMELISDDYTFAFLTLTIPNVKAQELSASLDDLQKSWNKFSRYKRFKNAVKGYVKTLEVTQTNEDGSFHPHYHCILALDKKYFKGTYYIKQDEWQQMWSKATGIKIQAVDIRKIKPKKYGSSPIVSAICEIAKYMVKPSDYLRGDDTLEMSNKTDFLVKTLNEALEQVKLISYGGCFLEARSQLKQDDLEQGDLSQLEKDTLVKYYAYLLEHYQRRPQTVSYERIDETIEVIYDDKE